MFRVNNFTPDPSLNHLGAIAGNSSVSLRILFRAQLAPGEEANHGGSTYCCSPGGADRANLHLRRDGLLPSILEIRNGGTRTFESY